MGEVLIIDYATKCNAVSIVVVKVPKKQSFLNGQEEVYVDKEYT